MRLSLRNVFTVTYVIWCVRDPRNHPSVWLWEPILNETWYPADFAKNTNDIVHAEYPYPSCYCGSDSEARGHEVFPVLFTHPRNADAEWALKQSDDSKTISPVNGEIT